MLLPVNSELLHKLNLSQKTVPLREWIRFHYVTLELRNTLSVKGGYIPCKHINFTLLLKVHKIEIFFGFDFEICIISLLVMSKY
jgi:hypothetical protein